MVQGVSSERPPVRVVCVAYHPELAELTDFATSLGRAATSPVELVIVDNGSDHDVTEQVAREHGARLIVPGRNLGYGAAANLGARGATQPWIVVANQDVVWHDGTLDALLDAGQDAAVGSIGPALLNPDGSRYPSARALPSLRIGVGHALLVRVWPGNPWTRRYQEGAGLTDTADGTTRPAGWLSGACLLLRREAFESVGGFDEGYFMFFEDVDLGERLGRAGWVNLHVPMATVTHAQGTSWKERPAPMIRAHHASARRYLARRYPRWYQLPLRVVLSVGLRLRERLEIGRTRG